ncbi:glycosyltransferase involved in cell wall biosynthesis [Winogradskyella epiphytica]|uniref:Glycosyltransferase involved in cell wall biosynthesis n=1 Tax=Winogradskyella epiphytica TaxID=262005 RepID=A0A2V4WVP6_9FLAO|nr:glycosyltransferase family 2 protein [Winogradskyella epiphytica]PYE81016.1 glycosyltransferase involved in cell wall biosynthesis [Winogradskyella epiphytica]GGW66236.1 beta 1,4 glucosyltransferase [Winogradskyella epiphytica]
MDISGLVITYNEEKNIEKCIDALFRVCNEVIIVDSMSSDATVEIAQSKGAKVISQAFLGDGPQRTHGLQYCKNDWILNLDADEFLDTDAEKFIMDKKYLDGDFDGFSFRVKNFLGDELIDFSGWYPDHKVRFFNKKSAKPSESKVHQKIITTNEKKVNVHILHYGWDSFEQIIAKKNQYSTWHANQLFNQGKRINSFKPVLNGTVAFVRCYFFKKGVFNGLDGITIALIQAFFSYMKYAKLIKLQRLEKLKG